MTDAPDTLDEVRRDLARALKIMANREPEYLKAREYADGKRAEIGGSRVAETIIAQSKATPISFAHVPIEVVAEKVTLTGISAAGGAQRALDAWAEANDVEDEAAEWIREGLTYGDYYVITNPAGVDDNGDALEDDLDSVGVSPLEAVVVYDRRTKRIAEYGVHIWDSGTDRDPEKSAMILYDDVTIALRTVGGGSDAQDFVYDVAPDEDDEDARIAHNGGRMLIEHFAVLGRPYGVPIHRRAWAFQDAIAKISANNLVNVDASGLPARWALLDPAAEVDDDIDDDFGTDGSITAAADSDGLRTPTKSGRVRTIPGSINMLRGVKSTGTYAASDGKSFLDNLDWYVRGMAVACGVPLFEFDMSGNAPSGESRRRAEARVNKTARRVQRSALDFFEGIARTVCGVVGVNDDGISITFAPIESSSDKEGLELVALKVKAGVPVRVALIEAGYTTEEVSEWMPDGEPAMSPDLLTALAEVLSKLGTAKTLGVISDDEIAAMLPEILTGARGEGVALLEPAEFGEAEIVSEADPELAAANAAKAKAEALGALVRAGADAEEAAAYLGLDEISFPNVPTTVRLPEDAAASLEGSGPTPPAAPEPPLAADAEPDAVPLDVE